MARSPSAIKTMLLEWCKAMTREYTDVRKTKTIVNPSPLHGVPVWQVAINHRRVKWINPMRNWNGFLLMYTDFN